MFGFLFVFFGVFCLFVWGCCCCGFERGFVEECGNSRPQPNQQQTPKNKKTNLGQHVVEHAHGALPLPRLAVHVDERVVRDDVGAVPLGAHLLEHVEREVARVALLLLWCLCFVVRVVRVLGGWSKGWSGGGGGASQRRQQCGSRTGGHRPSSRRPRTAPAARIAPPASSRFSVKVVLPASGWLMMAKVRRRAASAAGEFRDIGGR